MPNESYNNIPWYHGVTNNDNVSESAILPGSTPGAFQREKAIATEFYYWWHNQPGSNTQDGYDDWWRLKGKDRFGGS